MRCIVLLLLAGCASRSPRAAACNGGTCVTGVGDVGGLAVDDVAIYWTEPGRVASVRKADGVITKLAPLGDEPGAVHVSATTLAWLDGPVTVHGLAFADGAPFVFPSGSTGPLYGFALVGDEAFYNDDSALVRSSSGGLRTTVLDGVNALSVAVQGSDAFFTSCDVAGVTRVPIDGGTPTGLASNAGCPIAIATNADSVLWTDGGMLFAAPLAGGDPHVVSPSLGNGERDDGNRFLGDGDRFYFVASDAIWRLDANAGDPAKVADVPGVSAIAVDETAIYWAASGTIFTAPK